MHSLAVRLLRTSATPGVKHGNIFRNLSCLQNFSSSYVATNKFLHSGLRNTQNGSLHAGIIPVNCNLYFDFHKLDILNQNYILK